MISIGVKWVWRPREPDCEQADHHTPGKDSASMMCKMQKLIRSSWVRWVFFLGLCALSPLICKLTVFDPYTRFLTQERQVRPLFVALNNAVLATIPPPDGVVEVKREEPRSTTYHGVSLVIVYTIRNISSDSIFPYYGEILLSNGWEEYQGPHGEYHVVYYRGTSCVDIFVYKEDYYVSIYHDFLGQEFSPKMPPFWLVQYLEFGETSVDSCPP